MPIGHVAQEVAVRYEEFDTVGSDLPPHITDYHIYSDRPTTIF